MLKSFTVAQKDADLDRYVSIDIIESEDPISAINDYKKKYNEPNNKVIVIGENYASPFSEDISLDEVVDTLSSMSKCLGQEIKISTKRQKALLRAISYISDREENVSCVD